MKSSQQTVAHMCTGESRGEGWGCGSGMRVSVMLQLKQKSFSFWDTASISAQSIHKFASYFSSQLRHQVSQVKFMQTVYCASPHTGTLASPHACKHTRFNESQRTKEKGKQWNIWNLSQTAAGVHSGKWCYSFINPDWISSVGPSKKKKKKKPLHVHQLYITETSAS